MGSTYVVLETAAVVVGAAMLAGAFVSGEKKQNRDAPYDQLTPPMIPIDSQGGLQANKHIVQNVFGLMPSSNMQATADPRSYISAISPSEAGWGYNDFHFDSERGDVLWRADKGGRSDDAHRSWLYAIDATRFESLGAMARDGEEATNQRIMSYRLWPRAKTSEAAQSTLNWGQRTVPIHAQP